MSSSPERLSADALAAELTGAVVSTSRWVAVDLLGAPDALELRMSDRRQVILGSPSGLRAEDAEGRALVGEALGKRLDKRHICAVDASPGSGDSGTLVGRVSLDLGGGDVVTISCATVHGMHAAIQRPAGLVTITATELRRRVLGVRIDAVEAIEHHELPDCILGLVIELSGGAVIRIVGRLLGAATDGHAGLLFSDVPAEDVAEWVHGGTWICERMVGLVPDRVVALGDQSTGEVTGLALIEAGRRVIVDVAPLHYGARPALGLTGRPPVLHTRDRFDPVSGVLLDLCTGRPVDLDGSSADELTWPSR